MSGVRAGDRVVVTLGESRLIGVVRAAGKSHIIIDPDGAQHGHTVQTPPWRVFAGVNPDTPD